MEKLSKSDLTTQVFSFLMKQLYPGFKFPRGAAARRSVERCLQALERKYCLVGRERIVDFCICQCHALSRFGAEYRNKWHVNHSFGDKALERYDAQTPSHRYYQDLWLREQNLSRKSLYTRYRDRSEHPLQKFVYPEYEETTKRRLRGSEAQYCICQISTLLWTPFSEACRKCSFEDRCREITRLKYHELFRLRIEQYNQNCGHGCN